MPLASLGDAFLFDLSANPVVGLDTFVDSLRFYVPQAALNQMADEDPAQSAGVRIGSIPSIL